MQIQNKPLKEIYKNIREAIKQKIQTSEELKDIQSVVYGRRLRAGAMQTPLVWIVPEPYMPDVAGGHSTVHNIQFDFVVLVKDTEPERGLETSQDLALTIYDVFMADRTLGGLVFDIVPARIDPAYEAQENSQVYWSAITLNFKIKRRE